MTMLSTNVRPENDYSLSTLLKEVMLEGMLAENRLHNMLKTGEDVSFVTNALKRDGFRLRSFATA